MDRYYTQTIGSPVLTASGMIAGRIIEIVIEPETGVVTGFLLAPRGQYVVAPSDVIFWQDNIFIQDEEDILETHEIIKVQEVLKKGIPIMRNKVYTKKGVYVGKVYDIGLNPKLFVMNKLAVAKNIFGLFPFDEKIIAHGDILEIKKDRIIIKDLEAEEKVKARSAKESLRIDIAPSAFKEL